MKRTGAICAKAVLLAAAALLCSSSDALAEPLQSGTLSNGYEKDPDAWFLHVGEGRRVFIQHVDFASAFTAAPRVVVSLRGVDADTDASLRILVDAENVTKTGFDVRYSTWANSRVYTGWVSWTAHAP